MTEVKQNIPKKIPSKEPIKKATEEIKKNTSKKDEGNSSSEKIKLSRFEKTNNLSDNQLIIFDSSIKIADELNKVLLQINPDIGDGVLERMKETILSVGNNPNNLLYFIKFIEKVKTENPELNQDILYKIITENRQRDFDNFLLSLEQDKKKFEYYKIMEEISNLALQDIEEKKKGSVLFTNEEIIDNSIEHTLKYYNFVKREFNYLSDKFTENFEEVEDKKTAIVSMFLDLSNSDSNIKENLIKAYKSITGNEITDIGEQEIINILESLETISGKQTPTDEAEIRFLSYLIPPMNGLLAELSANVKSIGIEEDVVSIPNLMVQEHLEEIRKDEKLLGFAHSNELYSPVDLVLLKTTLFESLNSVSVEPAVNLEKLEKFISDILPELFVINKNLLNSDGSININELYFVIHENRYSEIFNQHGFSGIGEILPIDSNNDNRSAFFNGVRNYNKEKTITNEKSVGQSAATCVKIARDFYFKDQLPQEGVKIYLSTQHNLTSGNNFIENMMDNIDSLAATSNKDPLVFGLNFPDIDFSNPDDFNSCVKEAKDQIKVLKSMINLDLIKLYHDPENHQYYFQTSPYKKIEKKQTPKQKKQFRLETDGLKQNKFRIETDGPKQTKFRIGIDDPKQTQFRIGVDDPKQTQFRLEEANKSQFWITADDKSKTK